ncbi:hypothetical protein B484DRAFT_398930 [Ochromonadaceae sp. CCMP2298]|nr:hypothetical protein B484DRAFT_398930 [Ochromonadaceae sp. CCMP2298]
MLRVFYLLVLLAACSQMGRDGVGAFVQEAELEEAEDAYTDEIMVEEDGEATMETMESAESADAEEADSDNPWVAMFGPTLYKWADGREEIHQMSTVDLLQGTQVVALYYSASW